MSSQWEDYKESRITFNEALEDVKEDASESKYPRLRSIFNYPLALLLMADVNHQAAEMSTTPLVKGIDYYTPPVDGRELYIHFLKTSKSIYEGKRTSEIENLSPEQIDFAKRIGSTASEVIKEVETHPPYIGYE